MSTHTTAHSRKHTRQQPPGQFDVIVVGAGIVGAASACLFARQGLNVGLIEAQSLAQFNETPADDRRRDETPTARRVSAIGIAASNLLAALEVWHGIAAKQVSPYSEMKVWDCNSAAKIHFAAADIGTPYLGHIIDNHAMVAAMLEKLRQNDRVTMMDNTEIRGIERCRPPAALRGALRGTLRVAITGKEVTTRLLVGADGGGSKVRELCGITARASDFAQDAIVSTISIAGAPIAHEHEHEAIAWQCFTDSGPVAMLPLADGRYSLVWSCDRAYADELMALEDAQFCTRLQALFFAALGEISGCERRQRFALGQQHADRYIADSVALVGDAAHITHPLAGLGANLGLLDVAALAEVVERADQRGMDIGGYGVLRRYERWRFGDNALVLAMMEGFNDIFTSRRCAAKVVRSTAMNLVDSATPLKSILAKLATGLYGDLPALCRRA